MNEQVRRVYVFGPFRLDARKRLLSRGAAPVKLAPKAFDTLLALVESGGQVLDKGELMKRLWPDRFVEEGNLTLNISNLRKALGETPDRHEYIVTLPGQGYQFVAHVTELCDHAMVQERPAAGDTGDVTGEGPRARDTVQVAGGEPELTVDHATPLVVPQRAHPPSRGRVARLAAMSALSLIATSGAVWLLTSEERDPGQARAATPGLDRRMTLRRFTTHGGVPLRVAISPDGKSLVYQQRMNGKDSLWLGQTATNSSVMINDRPDLRYGEVAFSPDGSSIYFAVTGTDYPEGMLVRMPLFGGVMTELIANVQSPIALAPDGAQLAFLRADDRTGLSSVVLAATADPRRQRTLITRQRPESFSDRGISWSPDGKTIAVGARRADGYEDVAVVRIADGSLISVGGRHWGRLGNLAWLKDGSGLVLLGREHALTRRAYLWFIPYPGGAARKVSDDVNLYLNNSLSISADGRLAVLQGYIHSAIWVAPNGDVKQARRVLQGVAPRYEGVDGLAWTVDGRLLYTAYSGDSLTIWSTNRDGSDLRQVTASASPIADSQVSVTRDGRYIVFQSDRSGSLEIWRANMDGSGLKQLTRGGNNSRPSLSPDGRWVIYASARHGTSTLWRTTIDGEQTQQLTQTPSSWPQVSPRGTHIAYTAPAEAPDVRLTIMPFEGGPALQSFVVPLSGLTGRRVMRWTPDGGAIIYKDDLQGVWQQALAEDSPRPVPGFEKLLVHHLAWSFDGKALAYASGPTSQEIILVDHLK
jgi:Tol biopolymer transport system component/DNA-binding winged helix-turn-helix (wHTH) protein